MLEFTQQIINGLSLGAIYALIALGYTMVYGIIKLINFAHGDIMMVGAFVGYFSLTLLGTNIFVAMLAAMLTCAVFGVLIEKIAYRPLRNSTRIAALITAIGVSLFLEYMAIFLLGPSQKVFPDSAFPLKAYTLGGLSILNKDVFVFVSAVVLMLILQYIIKWTKTGKAMRAVSLDREAAVLMGISVDKTISITFAIGSALAAAAGVMVGVYYNTVNPLMGIIRDSKLLWQLYWGYRYYPRRNGRRICNGSPGNHGEWLWQQSLPGCSRFWGTNIDPINQAQRYFW